MKDFYRILTLLLYLCSLLVSAQTKPKNHWQLGGSVGYAQSIQRQQDWIYKDIVVEKDSVVDYIPGNYRYGNSTGINTDLEAIYQKKSGWYNVLGLQSFISLPKKYYEFLYYDNDLELHSRYTETSGYVMMKFGFGYRTKYKRHANLFLGANLLYGAGWLKFKYNNEFTGEGGLIGKYSMAQSFFLTFGLSAEAGTLLRINRRMEGVIKAGINAAMFSVWKNSVPNFKDSPFYDTGDLINDWYNINFSLGIRYKL